ncbi:MAG TPA: DUF433 domain-containing protein [Thermoanaerobaculia bacterium]|nr:DUF433 domain-containing protein [Thermoanaerobaculia bacterium]
MEGASVRSSDGPRRSHVVTSSPDVLGGTPVFAGTRVPVRNLLDDLEAGEGLDACRPAEVRRVEREPSRSSVGLSRWSPAPAAAARYNRRRPAPSGRKEAR